MRFNSEGERRDHLLRLLRDPHRVQEARRVDMCLLCRREGVDAAGLCPICYGMLDGEELKVAINWRAMGTP